MPARVSRVPVKRVADGRGWLVEVLRCEAVGSAQPFGQVYAFSCLPGHVRANHYHTRKREWFCCLEGSCDLHFEDLETGERGRVTLDSSVPESVGVHTRIAHAIVNRGTRPAVIVAYVTEAFDAADPDTFPHIVVDPKEMEVGRSRS